MYSAYPSPDSEALLGGLHDIPDSEAQLEASSGCSLHLGRDRTETRLNQEPHREEEQALGSSRVQKNALALGEEGEGRGRKKAGQCARCLGSCGCSHVGGRSWLRVLPAPAGAHTGDKPGPLLGKLRFQLCPGLEYRLSTGLSDKVTKCDQ